MKFDMDIDDVQTSVRKVWGDAVSNFLIHAEMATIYQPSSSEWTCQNCRRRHLVYGAVCARTAVGNLQRQLLMGGRILITTGIRRLMARASSVSPRLNLPAKPIGSLPNPDKHGSRCFPQPDGEQEVRWNRATLRHHNDGSGRRYWRPRFRHLGQNAAYPLQLPAARRACRPRLTPMAVSLTVCRGRSHDEYYFGRPELITNEPTPQPYLALNRPGELHVL